MEIDLFTPRSNVPVGGAPAGLDSWCVVTSDPSGLLRRPAGTIAYLASGDRAWINVTGLPTGWVDLLVIAAVSSSLSPYLAALVAVAQREMAGVPAAALGANVSSFDVALPGGCDASGGFHFVCMGESVGAAVSLVKLRVNGVAGSLRRTGQWTVNDQSAPNNYFGDALPDIGQYNTANPSAGCRWMVDVVCPAARSGGFRLMRCRFTGATDPTNDIWWPNWTEKTWRIGMDIAQVGLETSVANDIGAGTRVALWRYPVL
jgi:hypothetical protein